MEQTPSPQPEFDVLIAGGGIAGVLAAARVALSRPTARIALIERETTLGGRLRGTLRDAQVFSYGLNAASDALYELWQRTVDAGDAAFAAAAESVAALPEDHRQRTVGILAGSRIADVPIESWFTAKGARALGGMTAAREWPEIEEMFRAGATGAGPAVPVRAAAKPGAGDDAASDHEGDGAADAGEDAEDGAEADGSAALDKPFAQLWKRPRKAASAVVLEHFASAFGIPDLWSAPAAALGERARFHSSRLHSGIWDQTIRALITRPWFIERVSVLMSTRIVDGHYADGAWSLSTDAGELTGRSLVVAQPPWQASAWLRRTHWPPHVLQIASKTKPVSVVVLSERLERPEPSIPDVLLIPAESVQAVRNGPQEICFQATIDFELSLSAPAVVKAVRGCKRARKKLAALYPDLISETNHIALNPVAWAQPLGAGERRWLTRLAKKRAATPELSFCGDAYGASFDGDDNLIASLADAVEQVTSGMS